MTRQPIYTATIACTTTTQGLFVYHVLVYNRNFELRTVRAFDSEYVAEHYANQFWSF